MHTGHVDLARCDRIVGWIADPDAPDAVVEIAIVVNGREAGRVKADRFRADLKRLGRFGEGRHGFEFHFDPPLPESGEHKIGIRVAGAAGFLAQGTISASLPTSEPVDATPPPQVAPAAGHTHKAPQSGRELFRLLSDYRAREGGPTAIVERVEAADATPAQVEHAVFQRAPLRLQDAAIERYDAKAHLARALASPEFRARSIELFLRAYPEKRRLFFVHVPKCAGTDLRTKLPPRYPTLLHSILSREWTPDEQLFAALAEAARRAETSDDLLVFGHIELNRYVAMAGTRFGDRIFTVVRDPIEIAISQANYAVTVLVNDPAAKVPHTRENLRKLGIDRLPPGADPAELKRLTLQALRNSDITQPNLICSYLAAFGKGYAEAVRNIVTHNVMVTNTARYGRWLKEEWGIDSTTRHNASRPFLTRSDIESELERLAQLTAEDRKLYELITWALEAAGAAAISGRQLLDMVLKGDGPYTLDRERDEIVRRSRNSPAPTARSGPGRSAGGSVALLTMVYNESVNLPIWIKHYRQSAPNAELFVIDHSSDDGSTEGLDGVNRIPLPRSELDERDRVQFVNSLQQAFLRYYDTVIYTDCDELLVPNPATSVTLEAHLRGHGYPYATAVGINVIHIVDREPPLDFTRPLLRQRGYGQFHSMMCKPLVTRVALNWEPGFHACDRPPVIDRNLYLFHTKRIDRDNLLRRQQLVRNLKWSQRTLQNRGSAQHRYDDGRLLRELFLDPANLLRQQQAPRPFVFDAEIERWQREIRRIGPFFQPPQFLGPVVEIPEAFRAAF